jgi:glycerol-3-phosphate acyltransferase PlsY
MDDSLKIAISLTYGYLLGAVPMSYVVGRVIKGIDLRKVGSGNVGASNVWIHVGKFWVFPIGVFDVFAKGLTPALVARALDLDLDVQVGASLLAIVGHNWPVWLQFQGGRGVGPTTGVLLSLGRLELAAFVVIATAGWQLTKSSPVWVLIAFGSLPGLALWWGHSTETVWMTVGILGITVAKRLASNSLRSPGVSLPLMLLNRLLYDRDIADHDAWVERSAQ